MSIQCQKVEVCALKGAEVSVEASELKAVEIR